MPPTELSPGFPLSFGQERLWFLDQLEPGDPAWNVPTVVRFRGRLSPSVLEACLGELIGRHETLRTTFESRDGEPVQRIARRLDPWLPVVDLAALPREARDGKERRLVAGETARVFDLSRGPLLRTTLLRLAPEEHVLILNLHHIVCDGWSLGVLLRELGTIYDALSAGAPVSLPALRIQYADFASWHRQALRGAAAQRQVAYWRERLGGEVPRLDLPARAPRPRLRSHRGGVERLVLDGELAARLRDLGGRERATWFMVLLAAFQTLLARYAGQPDVSVGVPVSGRNRPELEGLVGFFLNTLVLRTDLSGDPPWIVALGRARTRTLEAYGNADVPFEMLLAELHPERSLSEPPLFQALLNVLDLRGVQPDRLDLRGLRLELADLPEVFAKLDLNLYAREAERGVLLELVYARDLFDPVQAERMLAHLRNLLAGVAADPHRRLSELPLASEAERRELSLRRGPRPTVAFPGFPEEEVEGSIPGRFERQVALHPERTAVRSRRHDWTYADLDRRVRAAARRLLSMNLEAGPVALLFRHDAPMIAAMLGALRAGRAYIPLDPAYPAERLREVVADAGIVALLAGPGLQDLAARLMPPGLPTVFWEDGEAGEEPLPREIAPGDVAYVLYTSGSSGRPKGVAQSHRNVLHHIRCYTRALHLGPGDRISLVASYSFDAAVMDIYGALLNGAALHVVDVREEGLPRLAERLEAERVTVYHSTPTLFRELRASLPPGKAFPHLRLVVLGGEEGTRDDLLRFRALTAPGALLVNGLGPTESTLALQSFWDHEADPGRPTLPVGWPVEGTEVLLLNGLGEQWAPYGIGEIVIRSRHVALGYWRRPDLTREAFADEEGTGLRRYRTGDLGRRLPDGALEFAGRRDLQVKIRGHRIEVAEVESRLRALPGVQEAAVGVRTDPAGEPRLVAWVLAAPGEAPRPEELRARLALSLADPMLPGAFVILDAFPQTPTGKVDRRALPEPLWERPRSGRVGERPRTPVEEVMAGIWSEVLGVPEVGIHDDFFALGGHSLLATRVAARLWQAFGVELPVRTFFEALTVAELARQVEAAMGAGAPPAPPLEARPRLGPEPLSFAQERLWFLDQLEPGPVYNLPTALRLRGPLSPAALEAALIEVVRRHEILRTRYASVSGEPRQIVDLPGLSGVPLADLSSLPPGRQEEEAVRLAGAEARRPFDLERGPVLRALLLRIEPEDHRAVVTLHHIAGDGWSVGVLLREIAALSRDLASPLPPLPVQYADFARWQRSWLTGDLLSREIAFWRERLAGAPAVLDLPTDRPRPAVQRHRGILRPLDLSAGFVSELRNLARTERGTLFMVLAAAFATLLARHAGQEEVALGSPVAGRTRVEVEGSIGLFVNTLVLRLGLPFRRNFRDLLRQAREAVVEAQAHQHAPFERLVEELAPERSLSHAPLFQAMLTLQSAVQPRLEDVGFHGLALEPWLAAETGAEKVDLTLAAGDLGDGLGLLLSADADLFDGTTAERLLERFRALLEAAVEDPGKPLEDLPLLAPAERSQVAAWSDGGPLEAGPECLHHLVEAQASRTPDAEAVVGGDSSLTYGELVKLSGAVARALRRQGVGPERRVGLALDRSPETIAALLGVLRAGGCWVPLDPAYPRERLAWAMEDAGITALLTRRSLLGSLPTTGAPVVLLEEIPEPPAESLPEEVAPGNLAYVLYTSGSTGRPKGVALEHRSAVALIRWAETLFPEEETRGMLASTSLNFDLSVFEIFLPLSRGGTVYLAGDALRLPELPRAGEITFLNTVPSAAQELVEGGGLPASLRAVGLAGEPLPGALARRLLEAGVERVYNLYGPSEDTTYSTWYRLDAPLPGEPAIGKPIDGTQAWVLDSAGRPVPPGVPGELYLGGAGLARGYLGRPDLTAERFLPDCLSGESGGRLYRTGDRVRFRKDGALEFLGRLDHQVKLRGFRIELGEVESALAAQPEVLEAAAGVREIAAGDRRLVAWIAFRPGAAGDPAKLREALRRRLPEPMVPALLEVVEALPRTPNGKLDRRALILPEAPASEAGSAPPRTPVEDLLVTLWSGLLGVPRVGVHDDFFALGGHSLLAARAAARVRAVLGVEIPLRRIFESRTVAALARDVEELRRAAAPRVLPLEPMPRPEAGAPLSFEQERLWIVDRLQGGTAIYHLQGAVRLRGRLSALGLEVALAEVLRRHEVLRSALLEGPEGPVQRPVPPGPMPLPPLPVVDLAIPGPNEAAVREIALAEQRRPFHFDRPPLLRALLVRLGGEDHVLLLTMHHAVSDGWSLDLLTAELAAHYEAAVSGVPAAVPELPIQYADYAVWQRLWLRGEVLEGLLREWRRRLAGAPATLDLPVDRPRPPLPSHRGAHLPFRFAPERVQALLALARREGMTPFLILTAVFEALLGRLAGQEDLCLGTVVAHRERPEIQDLIGFFVNTLVLRADLSGDPEFRVLLRRVREDALDAFDHQDLPFEKLVEDLRPERAFDRSPLFQAAFVYQGMPVPRRMAGLEMEPFAVESGAARFDLTLFVLEEAGGGLAGSLEYALDLFDPATARRLVERFDRLLEGALAEEGRRISELPLLGDAERQQLLREWGWRRSPYPRDATVGELFSEQVALSPEAVAVESAGVRWTYRELEDRSNRLGRHLRGLGVGPEVKVALCLERSAEAVWAILGIVKAGGAYVPIDPGYPAARQEMLLADAEARVVLTRPGLLKAELPSRTRAVDLGEMETRLDGLPGDPLEPLGWAESLAYVMYTSGSTGRPKGVSAVHRGIVRLVRGADYAELDPEQSWLQLAPLSFDASTLEIWGALLNGGRLVVAPSGLPSLDEVGDWVRRSGVTSLWLTAGLFHQVVEGDLSPLSGLRQLLAGGDVLSPPHVLRALEELPGCAVINGYGPTEATTFTCCHRMQSPREVLSPVPVGRPLSQSRVVMVDRWGALAPPGVPGELLVGGDGLARGYQGQPDRTAERFVPDPFGRSGERLYRTGDLARWRRDGTVEFLGRIDQQVKIRGFRIEPGEIESALARLPGVGSCAVLVREDGPGRRLVAYLTGDGDTAGAREALRRSLPEFMVPAEFHWLERLPLTPNGKVDYRELARRPPEAPVLTGEILLPRTPVELQLAALWTELLGVEIAGVRDSFFDLGGHSLTATRLASRVRETFGVEMSFPRFFAEPTIEALDAFITEAKLTGLDETDLAALFEQLEAEP